MENAPTQTAKVITKRNRSVLLHNTTQEHFHSSPILRYSYCHSLSHSLTDQDHVPLLLFVPPFPEPPGRLLARAAVDALERRHPFRPELSARGAPPWNCEGLLLLLPLAREEVEPIAKVGLLRPSTLALVAIRCLFTARH